MLRQVHKGALELDGVPVLDHLPVDEWDHEGEGDRDEGRDDHKAEEIPGVGNFVGVAMPEALVPLGEA